MVPYVQNVHLSLYVQTVESMTPQMHMFTVLMDMGSKNR